MAKCISLNSRGKPIREPRAFGFVRFMPLCVHTLGAFSGTGKRPSMILYHEFGHLFLTQPRGGILVLTLGTAVPSLWLAMAHSVAWEVTLVLHCNCH